MDNNNNELMTRDGIVVEKGVVLNSVVLEQNDILIKNYLNLWMNYPDAFLDSIQRVDDKYFHLFPYQRVQLRAMMRYRYNSWTATRATSKSFTAYLGGYLLCMFRENTHIILVSDTKETVIKTAQAKFTEIWGHWPLLKNELKTRADDGVKGEKTSSDYYELNFKNGSVLSVITKDKRGLRATGAIVEEAATVEEEPYNEVVVPTMNVPRRNAAGYTDPNEPSPSQTFITTAGPKTCFFYGKTVELAVMSVLRPKEYFVWGCTYKTPVHYGLLNKNFLNEQKYSNTYSAESFSRESLSIWTGANSDAWFDEKLLMRRRTLLNCERERVNRNLGEGFYIFGIDVGRYNCNTAITIVKVLPQKERFKKNLVYLEVINGENFISQQAPRIKELIELYKPIEVVIDGNGLGCGLLDAMAIPSIDLSNGKQYPAYYAFNNDEHLCPERHSPSETPLSENNAIIFDMKANISNDAAIHANIFSQMANGSVALLANERVVKEKLLSTTRGRKMDMYSQRQYLLPYEMTSRLVDEMLNLRLKPAMNNQTKVEQISSSIPKDRFSSLEYALWRVKNYEDIAMHKNKRKSNFKDLVLFTPRKRK